MIKTYRLAKNLPFAVVPFGPVMTLDQAMAYQSDMVLAGFHSVVVINQQSK